MSTETNLFDCRRASTTHHGGTIALSFHGPGADIVSIHLPPAAEAIVTAFVEAFNAHMSGETPMQKMLRNPYDPPEYWLYPYLSVEGTDTPSETAGQGGAE